MEKKEMSESVQGKRIADGEWPGYAGEYSKHKTDHGYLEHGIWREC